MRFILRSEQVNFTVFSPFPGKEWVLTAHYFKTGQLKFEDALIFKKQPLSKIDEAFEMYKTPGTVKGKILIDSEA